MQVPVNYLAVLACGVASMILGSIWYGPLFGKMWIKEMGFDKMSETEREAAKKGMYKSYALSFVGSLVMAYVLAHALVFAQTYLKASNESAAFQAAFWNWFGFIAPVTMGNVLWGRQSWKLWMVSNAYQLVQLMIFACILVYWK